MFNLKQFALTVSIAFVMLLFVYYGIETFYPSPSWERCDVREPYYPHKVVPDSDVNRTISDEEASCVRNEGTPRYNYTTGIPVYIECDYCYKELREDQKIHDRNVFVIASVIGIIAILLGTLKIHLESVSTGIMGGGVLSVVYGTIRYWEYAENAMKFVALGLVLAILIWIAYKKLGK